MKNTVSDSSGDLSSDLCGVSTFPDKSSLKGVSTSLPGDRVATTDLKSHSAHQYSNLFGLTPCIWDASKCLESFASGCNLTIHNVPGDGNCLFWSVLNTKTVCSISAPEN